MIDAALGPGAAVLPVRPPVVHPRSLRAAFVYHIDILEKLASQIIRTELFFAGGNCGAISLFVEPPC